MCTNRRISVRIVYGQYRVVLHDCVTKYCMAFVKKACVTSDTSSKTNSVPKALYELSCNSYRDICVCYTCSG
jgi:hypothetical protein